MQDFYYELAKLLFDNPDFRRAAIALLDAKKAAEERAETLGSLLSFLDQFEDIIEQGVECSDCDCETDECEASDDEVIAADEDLWEARSSDVWQL